MSKRYPPNWPFRFLRWYCPDHLYEEIEGDLLQKFHRDLSRGQRSDGSKPADRYRLARRNLIWNAFRFFRPGIVLRNKFSIELTPLYMFENYFKVSTRNLLKKKVFSLINITGLALGMAAFLLMLQYIRFERSYEDSHANADNIYRITLSIYKGEEFVVSDCEMYAPIGPLLARELPEVIDFARMYSYDGNQQINVGDKAMYEEQIYFADPSVLKIFSFPILHGNRNEALKNPFEAALTKSKALKYFGRTDVVGEPLEINKQLYKITAVLEDVPANTHLKFGFLLSHTTLAKLFNYKENEYQGNNEFTYLLMAENADVASFNEKLMEFSISLKDNIGDDRVVAEAVRDIHLHSTKSFEPEPPGSAQSVYFLMLIAAFVIVIAWINYINLATARAVDRAREVGIRKVMGSVKVQLIFQFLSESFIVSMLAAILCLALVYVAFPFFVSLTGQPMPPSVFLDGEFWYLFSGILVGGSILSGLYPAFVLSSFQPVSVLKGKFRSSSKGQQFRKGLVIFQFAATLVLLVAMSTVYLQITHLQNHNLGMNIDQILVLRSPAVESDSIYQIRSQSLKGRLLGDASVQTVTLSDAIPGSSINTLSTTGNVLRPGKENIEKGYIYYVNSFDTDFIPAFRMELAAGANFDDGSREKQHVIINEEALGRLGFNNPEEAVGSTLLFYDMKCTIIGVLKNFHQRSPKEDHLPMVFYHGQHAEYFSVRVESANIAETIAKVKATWKDVFPDSPFDYFFLDARYDQQYHSDQRFGQVIAVFSLLAVVIACLGLFGLTSYTIIQRTKEIGVRKVLGASAVQIVDLLSREFIKPVLIAAIVALPFAYFAIDRWLSGYAVRIELNAWMFAVPLITIVLISFISTGFQTIKAAQANPADTLKYE